MLLAMISDRVVGYGDYYEFIMGKGLDVEKLACDDV